MTKSEYFSPYGVNTTWWTTIKWMFDSWKRQRLSLHHRQDWPRGPPNFPSNEWRLFSPRR